MKIPKIIHQVWIGDKQPPLRWMQTWKDKHPDWQYILWDNKKIKELDIINKKQFEMYWNQKRWHGVADVLRYEILYKYGGFMPGADTECQRPLDELFENDFELYSVVNDCGQFNDPVDLTFKNANVPPLYASTPNHPFVKILIDEVGKIKRPRKPWIVTGNMLMKRMILEHRPKIKIWPSFYLLPEYQTGEKYQGEFKPYSFHHWGTTRKCYDKGI